jgi:protein SMG8
MPGHTFDISYVNLFKSLDNLRNKLQPAVSSLLRSLGVSVSREWVSQGRPASPRLLCLFLSAPLALRGDRGAMDERKDAKPNRHPPIKRLEYSIEDQIYRILRKARIITNVASNSLFAVPANQEFVYVETGGAGSAMDPEAAVLNTLLSLMAGQEVAAVGGPEQGPFYHHFLTEQARPKRCFANFLKHHINVGFERGFQDNISKHGGVNSGERLGAPLWEVPTLGDWVTIADRLWDFFTEELTSEEGAPHCQAMMTLRDDLETEIMFSELRCKKILPSAMAAYKEGLPQHYTQDYHQAKLLAAMSLYSVQARGPASEKLAEVLAADCLAYWQVK